MAVIHCTGADGVAWEVFEVSRLVNQFDAVRPQLAEGWLSSQRRDGPKVRVGRDDYAKHWADLPTAELLALMDRGLPSQPPTLSRPESS